MRQVWIGSVGPYLYDDEADNGLTTDGAITVGGITAGDFSGTGHILGTIDPSAGAGVAAVVGALYGRDNSGTGELWLKTGSSNTAWTQIPVP